MRNWLDASFSLLGIIPVVITGDIIMNVLVVFITTANKREQQIVEDVDSVDSAIKHVEDTVDEYDILAYAEEIK